MALISIVTIVRNDLVGLQRTQASVLEQSFTDWEWLVIDGASTDGTAAHALAMQHPQLRALSEPDKGIFDAMNKGLARAQGDFIVFMNAGDTFADAQTLQLVATHLRAQPIDFLYGDSLERRVGDAPLRKVARGHQHLGYGMFACHQSMYYRRSWLGQARFNTAFKVAGDYEFTARALQQPARITRLDAALCIFDLTGTSVANAGRGRAENWRIHRDVLGHALPRRLVKQAIYLATATLNNHFPVVYRWLRFRKAA